MESRTRCRFLPMDLLNCVKTIKLVKRISRAIKEGQIKKTCRKIDGQECVGRRIRKTRVRGGKGNRRSNRRGKDSKRNREKNARTDEKKILRVT